MYKLISKQNGIMYKLFKARDIENKLNSIPPAPP